MTKLSKQQELFIVKYFECGNGRESYLHAYPSSRKWKKKSGVDSSASTLLKRTKVAQRLKELRDKAAAPTLCTHQMLTDELMKMAMFDIRKLYDENGNLIPVHQLDDISARVVSSIKTSHKVTGKGEDKELHELTEIKTNDKQAAIDKLAKHLGYYELDNHTTLHATVNQYTKLPERKKDK